MKKKSQVKCHVRKTKAGKLVPVKKHYRKNPKRKLYWKWRQLINMQKNELEDFKKTKDGKEAGLSKQEAKELGIKSGQESAEWLLKMIPTGQSFKSAKKNWSDKEWEWAKRQVSINQRMRHAKGPLYDEKCDETPKHDSLLIWGHDPTEPLRKPEYPRRKRRKKTDPELYNFT